jgi:polar amino acid transport system substrate-binding protein
MQRLYMTQPYYAVPNYYFVGARSHARHAADLDGKKIGSCASCSHEMYLKGELVIPGVTVTLNVKNPKSVTYETEGPGLTATAKGKIDAFLAAEPVGQARIKEGLRLRRLPEVAFTYVPSGFVDKSSGLQSKAFVEKVDAIVQAAERDGTLKKLSLKYFGSDYIPKAAAYDINALKQTVR